MHPERWKQIKEILDIALRLEPSERAGYLARVCETDSDLRQEVDSLIEAHDAAGVLFDASPQAVSDPMLGARLGAYDVVESIGRGGMGSVYRAVRADDVFHKDVAIKIVRIGLDLERVVRQFRRERQITASLEHPNIAALIDGGATSEGLPYFVMEYIRGKPIDAFCREAVLKIRERLELFAVVCRAVQFAHERGVVHRDIKPGNILVTAGGVPKLLDFGIAKILSPTASPAGSETVATIAPAMTPAYASPEQLAGGQVTEASDVYSLGVLLYELIAGERPRPRATEVPARYDAEPPPPSRVAGRHAVPRDLDDIVMMAMRREPEKRYRSAGLLEADIRRYLASMPVLARKATRRYRALKFLERHRNAVLAAAVTLALSGAGYTFVSIRTRLNELNGQSQITLLTSLPGKEFQPSFSHDGKKILYVWSGENGENADIYVQSLEDGSVRRITTDPADDTSPVWSPDDTRVAWLRSGRAETAIFVARLSGGPHGKIADVYPVRVETVGRHLDWSPDGQFLAAPDKDRLEEPFHIVLIRVKDGVKQSVTLPPDKIIGDISPAFSPDGKSLAFLRAYSSGIGEVFVASRRGGLARRVTFDDRFIVSLCWTADSRSILFASERARNSALWRVPAAGGTPVRVPMVAENASDPAISPDGHRLAYAQYFKDTNIWRIDLVKGGPATKVISSTQYDSSPQYSPDGSRIVFRSNRSGRNEIWVSDSSGRTPVQLTRFAGPLTGTPRWSPDGMQIAFDTRPGGQADIYVVSSNGGAPRRVTNSDAEDVVPSWSRDGAWIYFASIRSGVWQVWRVPSGGGIEEQVTKFGGFAAFESPDGRYLYYAKSRSAAGLWRKNLVSGVEEPVLEQLKPGYWGYWAVVEDGVYYADQSSPSGPPAIYFFDLARRQSREIAKVEKPLEVGDSAFAVSPDRRHLLFTQVDQSGSDVLLLDHFR